MSVHRKHHRFLVNLVDRCPHGLGNGPTQLTVTARVGNDPEYIVGSKLLHLPHRQVYSQTIGLSRLFSYYNHMGN